MIKYPFYIKVFDKDFDNKVVEKYFLDDKNIFFYPKFIRDDIKYADVEMDDNTEWCGILHIHPQTAQEVSKILEKKFELNFELKNIRQDIFYRNYPFKLSEEFEKILLDEIYRSLTLDEVLDKIKTLGINSLSKEENDFLLSQTLDIS